MATNIKYNLDQDLILSLVCTHPTTPTSNAPVRVGEMTGLAMTNEGADGNAAINTSVNLGRFVATLSVNAIDGGGASAVAVGDKLYYTDADTPVINKKTSGRFFGYALEAIASGVATIQVLHDIG